MEDCGFHHSTIQDPSIKPRNCWVKFLEFAEFVNSYWIITPAFHWGFLPLTTQLIPYLTFHPVSTQVNQFHNLSYHISILQWYAQFPTWDRFLLHSHIFFVDHPSPTAVVPQMSCSSWLLRYGVPQRTSPCSGTSCGSCNGGRSSRRRGRCGARARQRRGCGVRRFWGFECFGCSPLNEQNICNTTDNWWFIGLKATKWIGSVSNYLLGVEWNIINHVPSSGEWREVQS